MRRGTTPKNKFIPDIDLTDAEEIYITYKQGCRVLEKTKADLIDLEPELISVELSQEETLMFKSYGDDIEIQVRAKFAGGNVSASNIVKVPVERVLKEGII